MTILAELFNFDVGIPIKVVYNGSNLDSFLSAFIVWIEKCKSGTASDFEFFNAERGAVPLDIDGKQLLCLGFTYKRQTINSLIGNIHKILVIDNYAFDDSDAHIKSNRVADKANDKILVLPNYKNENKSSSMMVWEIIHPNEETHPIVSYVQDRELFQFKLKNTREVVVALTSYPLDFGIWFELFNSPIDNLVKDGAVIRRYHSELNKYIIKSANRINFLGYTGIPVVNCPWFLISEVLSVLAQNDLFALGYYDKHNKRHFSLRSTLKSNINVLNIAKQFGGGGHINAAGFTQDITSNNLLFTLG